MTRNNVVSIASHPKYKSAVAAQFDRFMKSGGLFSFTSDVTMEAGPDSLTLSTRQGSTVVLGRGVTTVMNNSHYRRLEVRDDTPDK